ncbi:MAG TPA: hypothetical protein VFD13_00155 [Candidatus Kapabacteria bacterium]|nr:hypothetical protein [Candidatus Kapabacteria bacterium]
MKHEEQLNDFFEHALSPAEEQNFLISVAASDELRIAFRSQLELMKAVRSDKDSLRIGASPVAQVRNRTLAALGLSATAATPFIEQELMRGGKGHRVEQASRLLSDSRPRLSAAPGMQWFGHLLHIPALALSAGLLLGILSTAAVEHFTSPSVVPTGLHARVSGNSMNTPIKPRTIETIPAKNGLHNSSPVASLAKRPLRMAAHHAGSISASNTMNGTPVAKGTSTIPEVSRNQPGEMRSHKAAINQSNDTAKATK